MKRFPWVDQKKGSGIIYKHPNIKNAIVDTLGFGTNHRFTFEGKPFKDVLSAMKYAEEKYVTKGFLHLLTEEQKIKIFDKKPVNKGGEVMSEDKSDFWVIKFRTTCIADVCFDRSVTKEEAKVLFAEQVISDIIDFEWDFPTNESDIIALFKDY